MTDTEEVKEKNCHNCKGWYNSCSPDSYPDDTNPDETEKCSWYESVDDLV